MGLEAVCTARFQGRAAQGKALLETDTLFFRGEPRLAIPLKSITDATSSDGKLTVTYPDGAVVFELGEKAANKWANAILHPKRRVDKLGIKAGMRIALVDLYDGELRSELVAREADVLDHGDELDAIFLGARSRDDLQSLRTLSRRIKPAGAIWVVSPRGDPAITEGDVMDFARSADLVDVKVVRFSNTHTSAKLVIPVALRKNVKT